MAVRGEKCAGARLVATVNTLGARRSQMKYGPGTLSHEKMMRSIELYGRKVIPLVRDMLG